MKKHLCLLLLSMLTLMAYGRNVKLNVNNNLSLDDALTQAAKYGTTDKVTISINPQYAQTIKKKHLQLRCSLTLKSSTQKQAVVYFDKQAIAQSQSWGDAYISIEGNGPDDRLSVNVSHIDFMPIGSKPGEKFTPSSATDFNGGNYTLKIYFASKVNIDHVNSTLINGFATNLDLRECNNINITYCNFTNYNGLQPGNREGAIMSIRGNIRGLRIENNVFHKYGNDEIIHLFGSNLPEPAYSAAVAARASDTIIRENITIRNNSFIYGAPFEATPPKRMINDTLISIMANTATDWKNIEICNNTFNANECIRRVFTFYDIFNRGSVENFRIHDNLITHNYQADSEQEYWASDFYFNTSSAPEQFNGVIEIDSNKIVAAETLGRTYMGHIFLYLNGTSVKASRNNINATSFSLADRYSGQPDGLIPFLIEKNDSRLAMSDNLLSGAGMAGNIKNVASASLTLTGNNFQLKNCALHFLSVKACELNLTDNLFATESTPLLLDGFAATGSITITGNEFHLPSISSAQLNSGIAASTLTSLVVTDNRFTPFIPTLNFPPATHSTIQDNTLK